MIRAATLLTAAAPAGLTAAPAWPYEILAAAGTGLGVSALVPLRRAHGTGIPCVHSSRRSSRSVTAVRGG